MSEFQRLGVQPWLAKQCGYMALQQPTPIQLRCIPAILAGRHVVGGAATGSGKTAAFALPILQALAADAYGVFALVLTPSRELAYQIIDQFIAFGAPLQVRTMLAIGGVSTESQVDALKARPHIVAATPGRLRHLLQTFAPEVKGAFAHLRFIVLDEADRLTEGDIQHDVRALLRLLPPTPQRRSLLFTATLHPRLTVLEKGDGAQSSSSTDTAESFAVLTELGITDAASLEVVVVTGAMQGSTSASSSSAAHGNDAATATAAASSAALLPSGSAFHLPEKLQQRYLFIPNMVKLPYLVAALRGQGKEQSTIVYVNSGLRAELVRLTLQLLGFPVCSLDSLLTQQHRLDSVASFKLGIARILVCTDIAARGLDIPAVEMVLHYDVPKQVETYVHRVGRTARAGRAGTSVAFVTEYDVKLIHRIEKSIGQTLVLWTSPTVAEKAVLPLLDDVSAAKITAKQQVTEQFGARVQTNKTHAADKRQARAQLAEKSQMGRAVRPVVSTRSNNEDSYQGQRKSFADAGDARVVNSGGQAGRKRARAATPDTDGPGADAKRKKKKEKRNESSNAALRERRERERARPPVQQQQSKKQKRHPPPSSAAERKDRRRLAESTSDGGRSLSPNRRATP